MKLEYKVPKGFRRVTKGKFLRGDRFPWFKEWVELNFFEIDRVIQKTDFVIRRIKTK